MSPVLALFLGLLPCACGGRGAARPTTTAEPRAISGWARPSRLGEARPAVRVDGDVERPAADDAQGCGDDCDRDGSEDAGEPSEDSGGVSVRLQSGMTLYSLSRTYQVPVRSIMQANRIDDPTTIPVGTEIVIPASPARGGETEPGSEPERGRRRTAAAVPAHPAPAVSRDSVPRPAGGRDTPAALMGIAWPIDGRITGGFGMRGQHHHHDGIDIDGTRGEEVYAVAPGLVVQSGPDGKYGKTVVIDHGDGVTTLYAHASRLLVREGDRVDQGDAIAEVGATGNARGTHLHFEVRRDGRPVDPLPYLRPEIVGSPQSR